MQWINIEWELNMPHSKQIEEQLNNQIRKNSRADIFMVFLTLTGIFFHIIVLSIVKNPNNLIEWGLVIIIGSLLAYPWVFLTGKIARYVDEVLVPAYIVVTEDGIRKVYGYVRWNSTQVYKDLLIPNFKIYKGDSFKDFGCTLAAVPCKDSDASVQAVLEKLELDTSKTFD